MYAFLLQAHSGWRYLVLLALVIAIVNYLVGWLRGGGWKKLDDQIARVAVIVTDIQLLFGLILWPLAWGNHPLSSVRGMEHQVWMILAVAMMHVGYSRLKRSPERQKVQIAAMTFLVTLLLIALGVFRMTGYII